MNKRQLWVSIVLLAALCLTVGVTQAQEKSYSASRFDIDMTVEEGGSVLVTETAVFDFVGGPFTFVFRELPLDHTDGISVLEASVDGVVYPVGANPGQVEISTGNPMRITWHLEPTSNTSHTVMLTYRADGVVRQEEGTDALYWQPLPDNYEYTIGESQTRVNYPAYTTLISEPAVLAGTAVTAQSPNVVTFTAQALQPDSPLVFMMQFAPGSLISAPPNWQVEQQTAAARQDALNAQLPVWFALGLLILGGGLAGMFLFYRRGSSSVVNRKITVMEPPSNLPAGMAGVLITGGSSPTWVHAQGTLFSLAERGMLIIEELPDKTWYRKHDFVVKQVEPVTGLRLHEEGFLDMLFTEKNGRSTSIKLSDMGKKITGSAWKLYKEPLQEELKQGGYLSKARQKLRTQFFVLSGFLFVIGLIGAVLSFLSGAFGFGPVVIMGVLVVLAVAALIFGTALSPLSDAGLETAVAWRQFSGYLKDVSKGNRTVTSPTMFEKYLPYAAAFGLLQQWAKQFEKEGWTETPAYFRVLPTTTGSECMAVFVAMSAATSSSGGSAAGAGAGAAGAGAAGGGASGAG